MVDLLSDKDHNRTNYHNTGNNVHPVCISWDDEVFDMGVVVRITNKQLMMLFQTLKDTLVFYERSESDPFCFSLQQRTDLLNDILNQQSDELIEVTE